MPPQKILPTIIVGVMLADGVGVGVAIGFEFIFDSRIEICFWREKFWYARRAVVAKRPRAETTKRMVGSLEAGDGGIGAGLSIELSIVRRWRIGVEEGGVEGDGFVGDFGLHVEILKEEKYFI